MRALRSIFIGIFFLAGLTAAAAQDQQFAHKGVAKDAERYETYIRDTWKPDGRKVAELRQAAERLLGPDPRGASRTYAIAVATDRKSPENWIGLAKALLAIKPDPDRSENYDLPVNASGAAYRAYLLAEDRTLKARALAVLGEAMSRRHYWRPAIDALKASLALADDASVRDTYEKVRAEHGFRMTDYSTDSDAATPRVCVQFSENLSRGQTDFSKFVSVNGRDPQSVSAEGSQLCIDGVEHGERYEIQVRAGLPSDVNEPLAKAATLAVYVPDRKPMVHFTGKSYVLPTRGQNGIPLVAINTKKVGIEVYRIGDRSLANALNNGNLDRQLQGYELEELKSRSGSLVYEGELEVASKLNAEVTVAFPVSEAIGELKPGAYAMIARPEEANPDESWREQATQWFIVSDLGLTAFSGDDGVHAFVRSLASAEPISGAEVRLVARNNEILATGKSDNSGYVRFESGQSKGEGGNAPAILVAENGAGEYAFLDLTTNAFDLSDRGVKGRDAPGPLDGYLYTERGVYRPGEEVNISALVRDGTGAAATLPVTLIVVRPDGVEHGRYALSDNELGGRTLRLALGGGAMTGTWRTKLHTDPKADPITQVSFLVEDYVPERLDLVLTEGAGQLAPEESKTIDVAGRFLYGPPAAGMALEGDIVVRPSTKDLAGYEGYRFGEADETVSPVRQPLESLPSTDDEGKAALAVTLPAVTKTAKSLEANVIVRLREAGGRTIERSIVLPVTLGEPKIGIKPLFNTSALSEGEKANFNAVLLNAEGKPVAGSLDWNLVRLDTSWQWYRRDGYWAYESQTITRKIANGKVDATADTPAAISAEVDYGRYRLEVSSADAGGTLSSVVFNAGWYTGGETAESPEMLDVALDKATYQPGETAKLRIASKQGGKALVTVLGRGLLSTEEIELPKGGGDVEIKVGDDWGPGAYATALLYRPMDEAAKRMPSRAIGVRWIGIDQAKRTLKVALATEPKIKSASELTIPVKVEGLEPGEEARVTIAAVDVGILNLTRYQVPAPEAHFYAQQKLALELRDFYGRLIDGMRAERGKLRSGGDGMDGAGLQGSPPVEETVSYYSGILTVGADGTANASFALPSFNGTVRVMAVAWTKNKVGHGTSDVIVRDTVALTASAPRFLTLGDEAIVDLSLHNVDGPAGTYTARLTDPIGDGAPLAEKIVDLKAGERKSEQVSLKPHDVGTFIYDVAVTGPEGLSLSRRLQFDVKPPAGDIKRTTVAKLAAGGKLTLSRDLLTGLIANRTRVNLSVGPAATMDVPGLLTALDRYPYGCAEQTVSRALPLLYANAVAARIGIGADKQLKERVQGAVARVFEMQDSSGAFGSWGPGSADLWLTSYVTDFLTRARESGYDVRQIPFNQALDRLQNFALNGEDFTSGGEDRAYALYVLARNGRAPVGELRYYADTRLDRFTTPLAKAQLGAALAMVGDKERSETAFKAALDSCTDLDKLRVARSDYGSDIRDGAALVTLASETGIVRSETPRLVNVVAKAYLARAYTSTQEQAWMLLAAHALGEQTKDARLALNGAPIDGSLIRALSPEELEQGVTVTNNGEAETDAVVTVIGASLTTEPAVSKGFTVTRTYYTLDGKELDLESADGGKSELAQNERLVAVLTIESDEAAGRVLLVDRLPAGLEIENPRLVDGGDVKTLDWLRTTLRPEHTEFRDDRFVAAFDLWNTSRSSHHTEHEDTTSDDSSDESGTDAAEAEKEAAATATVAYIVRAVTPGTFVHPAATVEDMYRPERYARSGAGTLVVKPNS
ncbi:alpha-2-macroglobulin [Hyphomicrobium sp.]|uniref:alpha-2-macroglobulin family protein n=1 Tax=Hyphomicrobium sp. TaxID=82 RepID=UPI0025C55F88|nr:alpha-2-macroglobulin [Hyphomicrobium sp.]MCC7251498.1 alpha-2-macroglobulin family protein [Hyphomicrobium sp.]